MADIRTSIKNTILELCAEDDYGSWELLWAVTGSDKRTDVATARQDFVAAIEDLVVQGAIVAKTIGADGKLCEIPFSRPRLEKEVEKADCPDPDHDYWFGLAEH
ncbi:MAG TPA: hypothetical protein VNF04_14895 [Stellaceae bacterium]|nr:hypothetical protein [Stellaceae bacterium]